MLDRYERPLVRYACTIVGDLDSARDVVQDVFIRWVREQEKRQVAGDSTHSANGHAPASADTIHHSPLTTHASHPEAWLFTVTRHRALDHQRKHRRIIPMPLPDDRPSGEPGPAATLERREAATSLFRLLDALSPNQREVIRLKFQNDLSYREIADVTQLSVTNVGFLLHTGLKKLRALLREQPLPDFDLPLRSTL